MNQIRENPSMQYFCGYDTYTTKQPFDTSLMVHFRKRINSKTTEELMKEAKEYDEKIAYLALAHIDLDLDDGVKVNYEKLQIGTEGIKRFCVRCNLASRRD